MGRTVYLIGLDSVPVRILKEISNDERFDAIRWFVRSSDLQDLKSHILPVTASAWLTIYTGMREGELGLYDFMKLGSNYGVELADYNINQSRMVWESGKRCLVITPPMVTLPSENPKVDMITGFPSRYKPNNNQVGQVMNNVGLVEEPDVERRIDNGTITPRQAAKILANEVRKKTEFMHRMLAKKEYDFVFLCITETDRIQHFTLSRKDWKEIQTPIYEAINDIFRYLRKLSENEAIEIIAVSDHGGIATYKKFLVNEWLMREGFAVVRNGQHRSLVVPASITNSDFARSVYAKMPEAVKGRIRKSGIADNFNRFRPSDLDPNKTVAFSATSTDKIIPIWFNDERFKNGRHVGNEVKKRLVRKLKRLSFVTQITDGRKYYGLTKKFVVPDLLVEVKDGYTVKPNEVGGRVIEPVNLNRGGEHTRYALIGTYPRVLKKGKKYSIKDVRGVIETQLRTHL